MEDKLVATTDQAILSTYCFLVPVKVTDPSITHLLFSPLAGTADFLDETMAARVQQLSRGSHASLSLAMDRLLWDRGYLFADREAELRQSEMLYTELLRFHREVSQRQIGLIPTYRCNLSCVYCFQDRRSLPSVVMTPSIAEQAFAAIDRLLLDTDPSLVDVFLYGGEPFQNNPEQREIVQWILKATESRGYTLKAISNGLELGDYFPLLEGQLRSVQITLDGPASVHNLRRRGPNDSFAQIVEGVNKALRAGTEVNLRVNVDHQNVGVIRELVNYARQQWGASCPTLNLFPVKYSEASPGGSEFIRVLRELLYLATENDVRKYVSLRGYRPFKFIETLLMTDEFPLNRFFLCEAQLNLWVLDPAGDIYACYEACGIPRFAVGTYFPQLEIDEPRLYRWRNRSSLRREHCLKCPAAPHCEGGCAVVDELHRKESCSLACEHMMNTYPIALQYYSPALYRLATSGSKTLGILRGEHLTSQ